MSGYPWTQGDPLLAADLNAAIANSIGLSSGTLPLNGSAPMTGPLTLAGNATLPLHAVPLQQLTASITAAPYLPLATGGIVSGPVTAPVSPSTVIATGGVASLARTLANRFGEVINVKDYGAVGDGVTNDTTAIVAALTRAQNSTVKTVYFPPSSNPYMVASAIVLYSGVTLFAYPGTATLKATAGNTSTPLLLTAEAGSLHDILIYGLTLDGNVTGQTGTGGARNATRVNGFVGVSNVVFDHCRFQNTYGQAVQFANGVSYSGVRNCRFDNIGMYWHTSGLLSDAKQGVTIIDVAEGTSVGNFCEDNIFTSMGYDCINTCYQTGMLVRGNQGYLGQQWISAGIGNALMFSFGSRGMHVVDNISWNASGAAYDLSGETGLTVVGNKSYNAGITGISIGTGAAYGITTGTHHFTIVGNMVMNSGQQVAPYGTAGLAFTRGTGTSGSTTDGVISGNIFSDDQAVPTQNYGIVTYDTGAGLPTLANLTFDLSNHMDGNTIGSFGGGLTYTTPSTTLPLMDGTAATGTSLTLARADHVHPTPPGQISVPAGGSIQAAHDALPATGGSILLAANTTYVITSVVTITKPNVHIYAPSWSTVVRRDPGYSTDGLITATGAGFICEGFTVDGNSVVHNVGEIGCSGDNSLIRNMQVINSAGSIFISLGGMNSRATGNTIIGLGTSLNTQRGQGIWAFRGKTVMIDHNVISGINTSAIGCDGEGSQIIGNTMTNCHTWTGGPGGAMYFGTAGNPPVGNAMSIIGNYVGNGGGPLAQGIEVWMPNTLVSGNVIENIQGQGIILFTNAATVIGNTIRNCGMTPNIDGISVQAGMTDFLISGNHIYDDRATPILRSGIFVNAGSSDRFTITGNVISGTTGNSIYDQSTGTNKTLANNIGANAFISGTNTFLGTMNIGNGTGSAEIDFLGLSTATRTLRFFTGASSQRWSISIAGAESTGNAGSDVRFGRWSDTGVFIDTPFSITRSTGLVTMNGLLVSGNVGFYNTTPVAKPTVSGAKGSNAALGSLIAALAAQGLIADTTTA